VRVALEAISYHPLRSPPSYRPLQSVRVALEAMSLGTEQKVRTRATHQLIAC